jgi:hypothetical protein
MKIEQHKTQNAILAEIISDEIIIREINDAINLLGNLYYQGYDKIIIHEKNIIQDFFDLKNKMAGEILQKFSNYRVRLVIIGDFSKYPKQSLKDFIYESNRGKQINFVSSLSEAIKVLEN